MTVFFSLVFVWSYVNTTRVNKNIVIKIDYLLNTHICSNYSSNYHYIVGVMTSPTQWRGGAVDERSPDTQEVPRFPLRN